MPTALAQTFEGPIADDASQKNGPKALGVRIRSLRLNKGLGIRELAGKIGVSPSLISQIELGRGAPSVKTLYALVAALDVPMAQLFGPEIEPQFDLGNKVAQRGIGNPDRASGALLQKGNLRRAIELEHGFHWECLTRNSDPNV